MPANDAGSPQTRNDLAGIPPVNVPNRESMDNFTNVPEDTYKLPASIVSQGAIDPGMHGGADGTMNETGAMTMKWLEEEEDVDNEFETLIAEGILAEV